MDLSIAQLEKQKAEIGRKLKQQQQRISGLRRQIDRKKAEVARLEEALAVVLGEPVTEAALGRRALSSKALRARLPRQKDLIMQILADAGRPMNLNEIVVEMAARGYKWLSRSPKESVGVLVYTKPELFKKERPGYFVLAKGAKPQLNDDDEPVEEAAKPPKKAGKPVKKTTPAQKKG